ncbi:MAG: hypothetical protein COA70_11865 [Planctomycetota bacterium]|nr:MAG: hypothetical protein COA70_11865 [Planctomycetota bacterium]
MLKSLLILSVLVLSTLPASAQEDILMLKDGRIFDGLNLEPAEGGYVVHYPHGDVTISESIIQDVLLVGQEIAPYQAKNDEEKAKLAKGLVPFEGKWVSARKREITLQKRVAERRALVDEIDAHSDWRNRYKVKTKYFNFEHTIPPFVFESYAVQMEAYFAAFCKEWKVKPQKGYGLNPKDTRLLVCFYSDKDLFHQVTGMRRGVLGYFRFVKPLELDIYYDRLDPSLSREVMFHEANHYLQKLVNVEFSYPHWPGEALAEYYGASHWDPVKEKLTSGLILEGRLTEVQTDIAQDEWMSLEEMLSTDMYQHYTWGWTFVHFLMNDKRYEKKFRKFYIGLANDKKVKRESMGVDNLKTVRQAEVLEVFKRYMKIKTDEDFLALEREWYAYIERELHVTTAHGKEKAAQNAERYGRPIRARRLYTEAIETGEASALAYHHFAELLVSQARKGKGDKMEQWKLAEKHWQTAIEMAPMTGEFYFAYGEALRRFGDKEEGSRMMFLAADIDPENRRRLGSVEDMVEVPADE